MKSKEISPSEFKQKTIALNITVSSKQLNYNPFNLSTEEALSAVQVAWVVSEKRVNGSKRKNDGVKIVLAYVIEPGTHNQKVVGVFVPHENNGWTKSNTTYGNFTPPRFRMNFNGRIADKATVDKFIGRYLPPVTPGARNPVRYF